MAIRCASAEGEGPDLLIALSRATAWVSWEIGLLLWELRVRREDIRSLAELMMVRLRLVRWVKGSSEGLGGGDHFERKTSLKSDPRGSQLGIANFLL